jgi:hypothetical protein
MIDRATVREQIIERANIGATKANAPELYHAIVGLLAYIDNDFSELEPGKDVPWFVAKRKSK